MTSKPGNDSAIVGNSGASGVRFALVTPNARNLFVRMSGKRRRHNRKHELHLTAEQFGQRGRNALIRHMDDVEAGSIDFRISAHKCGGVPLPPEP